MENEVTETQIKTKTPKIKASCELWDRFDEWMALHGYQTYPEGLRATMVKVTGFEPGCQQKKCLN